MKCEKHGKDVVGSCQWCGTLMCKEDIGKRLGKKLFCKNCSGDLAPIIEKRQLDEIKKQKEREARDRRYAKIIKGGFEEEKW